MCMWGGFQAHGEVEKQRALYMTAQPNMVIVTWISMALYGWKVCLKGHLELIALEK